MTVKKNPHMGSSLDEFLEEEGILEEAHLTAIKEVISWQLEQAMQEKSITKQKMADLMHTSRAQLDRLLDPKRGNVTIETLHKAATVVGRKLRIELA